MRYDIFKNGKKINTIISDEESCREYCKANKYTYQEAEYVTPEVEYVTLTREDEVDAILIDQEYRLTLLELGVNNNAI